MKRALLTLVVAVTDNGVIGNEGALPWRLPEDLRRFKAATLGKPVLMGRKTFDAIGKALPGRQNIVLTRRADWQTAAVGVTAVGDFPAALAAAGDAAEICVIGGAEIYALALPLADRILLTRVHAEIAGDTRLPSWDPALWRELEREEFAADERNPLAMSFITLVRVR